MRNLLILLLSLFPISLYGQEPQTPPQIDPQVIDDLINGRLPLIESKLILPIRSVTITDVPGVLAPEPKVIFIAISETPPLPQLPGRPLVFAIHLGKSQNTFSHSLLQEEEQRDETYVSNRIAFALQHNRITLSGAGTFAPRPSIVQGEALMQLHIFSAGPVRTGLHLQYLDQGIKRLLLSSPVHVYSHTRRQFGFVGLSIGPGRLDGSYLRLTGGIGIMRYQSHGIFSFNLQTHQSLEDTYLPTRGIGSQARIFRSGLDIQASVMHYQLTQENNTGTLPDSHIVMQGALGYSLPVNFGPGVFVEYQRADKPLGATGFDNTLGVSLHIHLNKKIPR